MTQEEKAKAYDEAIKRLGDIKTGKCQKAFVFTEGLFNYLFPEIKECNEDERIRKALICHISKISTEIPVGALHRINGVDIPDILAWLEKQNPIMAKSPQLGEQTPTRSEEDSVRLQRIIDFLWYNRKGDTDTIYQQEQDIDWLKSLKDRAQPQPKQEWSEEDETVVKDICDKLNRLSMIVDNQSIACQKDMDWLKSLQQRIGE